jgi:hypothetical protein
MNLVACIPGTLPDDTKTYTLSLKPAQIRRSWNFAFRESIDLALGKIQELLPASRRARAVVILSGGSMQNYHARTEIMQACKENSIECRAVSFDINVESR